MAAEDVGGIALEFTVDSTGFSAGIARMREELNGLKASAQKIEIGVAPAAVRGGSRTVAGVVQPAFGSAGGPGGTNAGPLVSPRFQVSAGSVRQLRTDINAQMRQLQSQGEAVTVNVRLGRVPYAAMRNEISQGIGDVVIRGLTISPAAIAGALRQVSAAVVSQSAPAAGLPRRATGGPVSPHQSYVVGDGGRAEIFRPTVAGTISPSVPHAERGVKISHGNLTRRQANFTGNLRAAARALEPRHIQGGLDWYTDAGKYGRSQAAAHNVDPTRALGALAALSAGTSWEANKTKFERILQAQSAGRPFPYSMALDAHRKAAAILSGRMTPKEAFATSPKVGQFYGGISGDLDTLTIDRWAARTASRGGLDQPGRGLGRARMERSWKKVAKEAGMQNAPFQAALWLLEKEGLAPRAAGGPVDDMGRFAHRFGMPMHERGMSSGYWRREQLRNELAGTRGMSRDRIRGQYDEHQGPAFDVYGFNRKQVDPRHLMLAGIDPSHISKNYRGGPAFNKVLPGNIDLSRFPRKQRLEVGQTLYGLGQEFPYAASRLKEVVGLPDYNMATMWGGVTAKQYGAGKGHRKIAGAVQDIIENGRGFGRPTMHLNTEMSSADIKKIGALAENLQDVVTHEFGHVVDFTHQRASERYRGQLNADNRHSIYSSQSRLEAFAEMFLALKKRGPRASRYGYMDEIRARDQGITRARGGGVRSRRPGQWGQHGTADREWLSTLGGWGGNSKYNKPDWDEALDPEHLTRYRGDPHDKGPGSGHVYTEAMDPVMYHVTHRRNMESILREGVQPQKSGINRYGSLNDRNVGTYWSRYPDTGWAGGDPVALATRLSNIKKPGFDEIGEVFSKKGVAPEHLMFLADDKRLRRLARGGAAMRGAGFVPGLRSIAQAYNRSAGLPRMQEHILHPLDADFSTRTALAYEGLRGGSSALDRRAYRAFAEETQAQYEHLQRAGFSFTGSLDDPYSEPGRLTKMQQAARDVHRNKHLFAFGSALEHPLLSNEENLRFRHVHDMMGHLTEGFSIGPRGEFNAAVKHSQMYSPLARRAMLAETHGQNSVVNFSPTIHPAFGRSIADVNREHPGSIYADQKARGLPEDIMEEFYRRTGIHRAGGGWVDKLRRLRDRRALDWGDPSSQGETFGYSWDEAKIRKLSAESPKERGVGLPSEFSKWASDFSGGVPERCYGCMVGSPYPAEHLHPIRAKRFADPGEVHLTGQMSSERELLGNLRDPGKGVYAEIMPEKMGWSRNAAGGWVHRAKGGPAHGGGLPRGMRVEFHEPGIGEPVTKARIKELFGKQGFGGDPQGWDREDILSAYVRDRQGRVIASSPFSYDAEADALHPEMTYVDPLHRRKGLATAMYVKTERMTGRKVMPSDTQTPFGRALWSKKERAFGKGYGTRRVSRMDAEFIKDEEGRIERLRSRAKESPFGVNGLIDMLRKSIKEDMGDDYKEDVYLTAPDPDYSHPLQLSSSGQMNDAGPLGRRIAKRRKKQIIANMHAEYARMAKRAEGGDAGKGLYIVNELGRETFVPKSHEHLIPPDVASQIPGGGGLAERLRRARGEPAAEQWMPAWRRNLKAKDMTGHRAMGGPAEINGVGPMLWQAPEDGWIIPNRLKNRIPHAADGTRIDMSSGSGFEAGMAAAEEAKRRAESERRQAAQDQQFERELSARRRRRALLTQGRNLRKEVLGSIPEDLSPGGFDPAIVNARIQQGAVRGLTGRASFGGLIGFGLGGGRARRLALAEAQATGREYTRLAPEKGVDTLEGLNHQIIRLEDHGKKLRDELENIGKTAGTDSDEFKSFSKAITTNEITLHGVNDRIVRATELQDRQSKALEKAQGGAIQNFAAVTAAGFAFNIGMQGVSDAMSLGAKAAAPLVDQLGGFSSTSQRVTKGLADQLPEAGTVPTLFARAGTGAGLSADTVSLLQKQLGSSVTAKAGANAAGQASDLFRAALGSGANSGLTGGYGGLFGTGFLGSELGGGKGFAETVAGDVSASKGQAASAGPIGDILDNFNKGLNFYLGPSGSSWTFRPVVAVTQEQLKVQKALLDNFNDATKRARTSQGLGAGASLVDVGIGSKQAQNVLNIKGIDDYTAQLAKAGVVFKSATGTYLTSITDINKAYADASLGFTLPDAQTFAAQSAQQLKAQEGATATRGAVQRNVEIPAQLGQQILAQPFTKALNGISDASKVTIADLTTTQRLQDQITADAKASIETQAQFIDSNVSKDAGNQFRQLMTGATNSVQSYGAEIADLNSKLADRQAKLGAQQYGNQLRLINRSIGDTLGFLGRSGGTRVGRQERQQYDLSRQSQALGLASATLQRAADSLSLQLNQRQINFQTAIAGFQAPGITGEERAARIAEAKLEASYAQKQQNISVQQYGIGGQQLGISQQQFGLEGQLTMEQTKRQLQDLEQQKALSAAQYAVEQEQIGVQKRIAALTAAQSQAQAKALSLFNEATNNFDGRLSAATQYAGQFGGTMYAAIIAVRKAIDVLTGSPSTPSGIHPPVINKTKDTFGPRQIHAAGGAFITNGPTNATYGEAGPEMGVFIRNPKPLQLGAMMGGGGGGGGGQINVTIDVHDNQLRSEDDIDKLTRKVTEGVKTALSREASLLGIAS